MEKHFCERLRSRCLVMSSDNDQTVVMDICVGFTDGNELAVSADLYDYEDSRNDCSTAAVVNSDDALKMARRHRISYAELPTFIAECMAEWREVINPRCSQVADCFKEITEHLLAEGCHFRIERTYGSDGTPCC